MRARATSGVKMRTIGSTRRSSVAVVCFIRSVYPRHRGTDTERTEKGDSERSPESLRQLVLFFPNPVCSKERKGVGRSGVVKTTCLIRPRLLDRRQAPDRAADLGRGHRRTLVIGQ